MWRGGSKCLLLLLQFSTQSCGVQHKHREQSPHKRSHRRGAGEAKPRQEGGFWVLESRTRCPQPSSASAARSVRVVGAMSQRLGFGSRAGAAQWVPTSLAKHPEPPSTLGVGGDKQEMEEQNRKSRVVFQTAGRCLPFFFYFFSFFSFFLVFFLSFFFFNPLLR